MDGGVDAGSRLDEAKRKKLEELAKKLKAKKQGGGGSTAGMAALDPETFEIVAEMSDTIIEAGIP